MQGKNDGEKFQTYQIENVEADAEIIVEMDNEDLSVYEAEDSTEINGATVTAKWNNQGKRVISGRLPQAS